MGVIVGRPEYLGKALLSLRRDLAGCCKAGRFLAQVVWWGVWAVLFFGCIASHRLTEISREPYRITYEDEVTARFSDPDDNVFIEVRRAEMPRPLEDLAVHYGTLFPGGEPIRPGDMEEYVDIQGLKAYKVTFQTKYVRKRKWAPQTEEGKDALPPGWTVVNMPDPTTGRMARLWQGPPIPRERILYLVPGKSHVYYLFFRADGDAREPARKKFEEFVRTDITYR